jgi:hypothetical protein
MDKKKKTRKSGAARTVRDLPLKTLPARKPQGAAVKGGRVFRITNVRGNAAGLGGGSAAGATPVTASISISGK